MSSANKILKLILSQRYPRLSLAILLAVIVHCTVLLTGALSFSFFSAPSDVNRSLTITLDTTPIEGLKESKDKDQNTVNEVQKAQASAPKPEIKTEPDTTEQPKFEQEIQNLVVDQVAQNTELSEPELLQSKFSETDLPESESLATNPTNNITDLDKNIEQQSTTSKTQDQNALESAQQPDVQANANHEPFDFILATESLLSLPRRHNKPLIDESTDSSPNLTIPTPVITARQQKSMERKIQRQLHKLSNSELSIDDMSWSHKGQAFLAKITPLPANDDMLMDQILVDVITEQDGKKLSTTLRLKQLAFSNFAQFIDHWDEQVVMHDDELNGRFHSNTAFKLSSSFKTAPRFHAKATTAAHFTSFDSPIRRSKVFLAGLETGVKTIHMPKPSVLFEADKQNTGDVQTILIHENSRLIFNADGSVIWQALDSAQPIRKYEISDRQSYFIAAPGVKLNVRGTVNGLAAVYSPKRITIEGNIRYAESNAIDQGGDFLGLISGRSIYVAKRKILGDGDLQVDAAIYAKDRFTVPDSRGKKSGTLSIFGSVTSGSISATEPRYATRINFDPRLESMRPPGFPVTDRYEVVARERQWQVVEDVYRDEDEDQKEHPTPQLNGEIDSELNSVLQTPLNSSHQTIETL